MATGMRIFSRIMRSLYAEKAVGTNGELAKRFREIRDKTRDDASVYLRGILAISAKFVASISEYFEYYEALDYEEWGDMISDLLEEIVGYRRLCEAVHKMHQDIYQLSKIRTREVNLMATEFKYPTEEYEKLWKELEDAASTKRRWTSAHSWIPGVIMFATPLLPSITCGSLILALDSFIGGIRIAAEFFLIMEEELRKFEGKAEKAQGEPKKLYYQVMNKEGKHMKSICQIFYAVLADVKTDVLAIPQDGTDRNYVDEWLEDQKKTIREKYNVPRLVQKLLKAITD